MLTIKSTMEAKLRTAFSPTHLELIDDSHKHAGHAGNPTGKGATHIGIIIVSDFFAGKSRIERSRAVHSVIAEEITKIHAITMLKTLTTIEFASADS